jgi:hypothetical protein
MSEKTYMIYVIPNFYEPDIQGRNQPHLLLEAGDEPEYFDTVGDAQERIDSLESDVYVTANGEAGRPEYVIVDHDPLEAYHDDLSYYNWDGCECPHADDEPDAEEGYCCGNCHTCCDHMIDQDRETVRKSAVEAD